MYKYWIILLIVVLGACQQKFDKYLWNDRDDMARYPHRESMLADLIKNHQIRGMHYKQITAMLGESTGLKDDKLYYNIVTDYGSDIDPVYGKDLVISFKDSLATNFEVKEWKH